MALNADPAEVYRSMGVTPIITASGSTTAYGGSKLRPEVMEAMNQAATVMVNIDELNLAAGKIIAEITHAEAGFVCSGASGGLVLQAAAIIAGSNPQKMARLPNTEGLSNEIIIHRSHRFPYDQCYAAAGAKLVEIGDGRRCAPWQLEAAFSDRTTAVAYLFSPFISRRSIPFPQVCEIAKAHRVPVIVDAASFVPPRANLRRFIAEGADLVVYSGGKAIRGPQGTGILCGRADLIEAAAANASPHQFLGRGFKVAKEEVIGLIRSLQIFVSEDEEAETRHYRRMCQEVVDAFIEIQGLDVSLDHDEYDYLIPHAVIKFTKGWHGPSPAQVYEAMVGGDPPVYLHNLGNPENLAVDPLNLSQDELEITIHRLREVLLK